MKRYRVKIERLDAPTTAADLKADRFFICDQVARSLGMTKEPNSDTARGSVTILVQDMEAALENVS